MVFPSSSIYRTCSIFFGQGRKKCEHFCIKDEIIGDNFTWLNFYWPEYFLDLMFIYDGIAELNMRFCPSAPSNERNYFNRLKHFGKKMNKRKPKEFFFYLNMF